MADIVFTDAIDYHERLQKQLVRSYANRAKPYLDCCDRFWRDCKCKTKGNLRIGIGRNLDKRGLTDHERYQCFVEDLNEAERNLSTRVPWSQMLDHARYAAILDLVFRLGVARLLRLNEFLSLLRDRRYLDASRALLSSNPAFDRDSNMRRIAAQIATGVWQ